MQKLLDPTSMGAGKGNAINCIDRHPHEFRMELPARYVGHVDVFRDLKARDGPAFGCEQIARLETFLRAAQVLRRRQLVQLSQPARIDGKLPFAADDPQQISRAFYTKR